MSMGEKLMEFLARSKALGHGAVDVGRHMGEAGRHIGEFGGKQGRDAIHAAGAVAEEIPGMIRRNPLKSAAGAGVGGAGLGAAMSGDGMDEDEAKDLMLQKFLAMHGGGV